MVDGDEVSGEASGLVVVMDGGEGDGLVVAPYRPRYAAGRAIYPV